MAENAARHCTGHSAWYLIMQQCWPKHGFSLLHFNKLDPPTQPFLMVVVSGGCASCGGGYGAGAFALAQPQCASLGCLFVSAIAYRLGTPVLWLYCL